MGLLLGTLLYVVVATVLVTCLLRPLARLFWPNAIAPSAKDQIGLLFVALSMAPMSAFVGSLLAMALFGAAAGILKWSLPASWWERLMSLLNLLPGWLPLLVPIGIYASVVLGMMINVMRMTGSRSKMLDVQPSATRPRPKKG